VGKHTANQKGFGAVEALLFIVIVSVIGGVGWYVMSANKNINKTNEDSVKSSQTVTAAQAGSKLTDLKAYTGTLKDYTDNDSLFTVKYPSDWTTSNVKGMLSFTPPKASLTIYDHPDKNSVIVTSYLAAPDAKKLLTDITGSKVAPQELTLQGKKAYYLKSSTGTASIVHTFTTSNGKDSVLVTFIQKQPEESTEQIKFVGFDATNDLPGFRAIVESLVFTAK
jgi:hypothetical protein